MSSSKERNELSAMIKVSSVTQDKRHATLRSVVIHFSLPRSFLVVFHDTLDFTGLLLLICRAKMLLYEKIK